MANQANFAEYEAAVRRLEEGGVTFDNQEQLVGALRALAFLFLVEEETQRPYLNDDVADNMLATYEAMALEEEQAIKELDQTREEFWGDCHQELLSNLR